MSLVITPEGEFKEKKTYHYSRINENLFKNLLLNRVYFSNPYNFNDQSELSYNVDARGKEFTAEENQLAMAMIRHLSGLAEYYNMSAEKKFIQSYRILRWQCKSATWKRQLLWRKIATRPYKGHCKKLANIMFNRKPRQL